ncbi:MAG TPA: GNAT family N-acetyltransferase [Streptosporangiaceae bacterium]|nr:GNAT family N-acetyltransferase [Streptosporangiaceae bacterium]
MTGPALHVTRVPQQLEWQAAGPGGEPAGTVRAWLRPDQRCSVFFDSARPEAYPLLAAAVAGELGCDLYATVDESDAAQLAACAAAGFTLSRRESYYLIPTSPAQTGLAASALPAGLTVLSASGADEDRLRLLDDELRQDVPGSDGWRWDAEGFRRETFSPAFDPATYLVAVEEGSGEYAGLVRVWNNPAGPRLGLIAVRDGYRRRGLARALLGRTLGVLSERGQAAVTAEVDDTNNASRTLLAGLGARRTGGCAELVRRR